MPIEINRVMLFLASLTSFSLCADTEPRDREIGQSKRETYRMIYSDKVKERVRERYEVKVETNERERDEEFEIDRNSLVRSVTRSSYSKRELFLVGLSH